MTRCRLFYHMIREDCLTENNGSRDWDVQKACGLCRKDSTSVSQICGHIDFMDLWFPDWLESDLTFANAKLNEGTTRVIRALSKYAPQLVPEVVDEVCRLPEPTAKAVYNLIVDKYREHARTAPPEGEYEVIAIDPPWPAIRSTVYESRGGRGAPPYATMSLEDIAALKLPLAKDAVVFLWTFNPYLHASFHLLEGWGLDWKWVLVWVKPGIKVGTLFRNQHEFVQVAFKGKPDFRYTHQSTVLEGPAREHSRKPEQFYAMVEAMFPGRKLDMFSRENRPGWDQWGAEVGKFEAA